jgi:flagellar hook-associated protein 2
MADPVRVNGFFSPFDYEAVIRQLTAARQSVLTKLDFQDSTATAKRATLASIQGKFASLLASSLRLSQSSSVTGKNVSTNGTAVSGTATPTATIGTFAVDVTQLATGTKAAGTAITAAIDATSPVGSSNFAVTPTNGTYTIATATGGTRTLTIGAQAAQPATLMNAANFTTVPTAGTFTLTTATGGTATLNIDPATQTLTDVMNAINGTAIGITATITNDANGRANMLTLTSGQGIITVGTGTDTSNFATAAGLAIGVGTATVTGATFTKQMTLNQVITDINASGIGVTATVTNDANGRANNLSLTSTQGNISLGNAGDGSNFLTATNLLASAAGTTRASTATMARLSTTAKMDTASFFGGAPAAGAHTITINGTSISYNTANDSLNDILNRITSSAAGVTATYDAIADKVNLAQTKTGMMSISLADDGGGGNLLSKLGLLSATQTLGANASYSIDGGAAQSSATNTVTLGNGVTLNLNATTVVGTPITVTVAADTTGALNAVRSFVNEFNGVMSAIDSAIKASSDKNKNGVLSGDASLRTLKAELRGMISHSALAPGGNFSTLGQVGLSFGAVGAVTGTTNTLQLDETKFKAALASDPVSVQAVLSASKLAATLTPGFTGTLASMSGTFSGTVGGVYTLKDDGVGGVTATFRPTNGGPTTTQTITVTANSTNTSLIPGMTLTFGGALTAGAATVAVAPTQRGVVKEVQNFAEVQSGAGGVLGRRQDTYTKVSQDLADQKTRIQGHIDAEMASLRKKFQAMEAAQARAQSAQSALTQMQAQIAAQFK